MQHSPSGGSVGGDVEKKVPLEWRPYGVLLLSGNSKLEKATKEKLLTVLSGSLTPRERGVFKVIKRVDLGSDKSDPEMLANAFHKILEQDHMEHIQPKQHSVPIVPTTPVPILPVAGLKGAQGNPPSKNEGARKLSISEAQQRTDVLDDELLKAAEVALELDERLGSPSHIYVFVDYPSTVAEVKSLITFKASPSDILLNQPPTLTTLLDGVVAMTISASLDVQRESIPHTAPPQEVTKDIPESLEQPKGGAKGKGKIVTPPVQQPVAPPPEALAPPSEPTAIAEASELSRLFKELQAAATVGGLEWTDFTFDIVECGDGTGEARPMPILTKEFKHLLTNLAVDKATFKEWLESVHIIPVPTHDVFPESEKLELKDTYDKILSSLYETSIGVSAIVCAIAETIVRSNHKISQPPRRMSMSAKVSTLPFLEYGDISSVRLARAIHEYEARHPIYRSGEPRELLGCSIDEIERSLWLLNDLPGVGHGGRKGMPLIPSMSTVERGIDDTELMQFLTSNIDDVHYTRKMLEFENMLGAKWKDKLRCRKVVEHLTPHVLPQRITQLIGLNVQFFKRYYAPDDSLLLAGYIDTPQGRKCVSKWCAAESIRHRPPFKDWQQENLLPQEYLTPRTVQALGAVVSLSLGELRAVAESTHTIFPSDHAVIQIVRTPHSLSWLSVHKDMQVFGLRPILKETPVVAERPKSSKQRRASDQSMDSPSTADYPCYFHSSFSDDSHIHIRRGDGKAIQLTLTCPSGLVLTISSDGSIKQQYANETHHTAIPNQQESCRIIVGRGTIISTLTDGSQKVMYASGSVASRATKNDPFVSVDEQGIISCTDASLELPNKYVRVHVEVDPESRAVIARRDDGVIVVTHSNGAFLTQHMDGTRILGNPTGSHLIIQKDGFPEVSVDVDVNLTAHRHANGMKVAVTKGGIRTRSIVRLEDGTVVEIDYDTRVIAAVNGIIRVRKSDGTVLIACDDGTVEYRPRTLIVGDCPLTPRREDEEELDSSTGAYYFNCALGTMQMNDHEHNGYFIQIGDGTMEPHIQIDLAGIVTTKDCEKYDVPPLPVEAVVNDPLEPFLLILHGDGTATEILRPTDMSDYLRQVQRNKNIQKVECISTDNMPSPMHIYLNTLEKFEHNPTWFADQIERQQILTQLKMIPTRASRYVLRHMHNAAPMQPKQVHVVRRLKEIQPFNDTQFQAMLEALQAWKEWCAQREISQDKYAVFDPRDSDTMIETMTVQKKIQAAYKAARAKKKAERQKAKDRQMVEDPVNMTTLQEVENEEDEDGDEAYQAAMVGDDSDDDSRGELELNVDDDYELVLTAFSQADTENTGRLNSVQTRRALVHALGYGVTQVEVNAAIPQYSEAEDHRITFEAFSRMIISFRESDNQNQSNGEMLSPRNAFSKAKPSPRIKNSPRSRSVGSVVYTP